MDNISLSIPNKSAREITSLYKEFTVRNDINEMSNCKNINNNPNYSEQVLIPSKNSSIIYIKSNFDQSAEGESGKNISEIIRSEIMRVVVVDDDKFVRNSTIRVINQHFTKYYPNKNLDIIEACDGIECLNVVYNTNLLNQKINFIILDETMKFMNVSNCYNILNEMFTNNTITKSPIFIVTVLESVLNKARFVNKLVKVYP